MMYKRIPRVLRVAANWVRSKWTRHPAPVYDLWILQPGSEVTKPTKRALLSYITLPFRLGPDDPRNIQFSNVGIARNIVRALNELGYIVDVVELTDTKYIPRRSYHLFIGHGGYNFERIASKLPPNTPRIYWSTGPHWEFWNQQERARIDNMRARRGVDYPYERLDVSEEWACSHSDGIIALGNDFLRETYNRFERVFTLNNAAYPDNHYDKMSKDFATARSNFLYFAGSGVVHKGLDLLLEAFIQVDVHLYICQRINADFYRIYRRELEDFSNIHLIGWVTMRSSEFYELVDKCAFLIHPSCSEGSAGSVVECMHQGLIPVLSRETTIDTDDYGIMLDTCSIDEIGKVVQDLSQRPPEWCEEMSRRTRRAALTEFSESAFLANMKKAIEAALAVHSEKG